MQKSKLTSFRELSGAYWAEYETIEGHLKIFPLGSKDLEMELKSEYQKQYDKIMPTSDLEKIIETAQIDGFKNQLDYNLASRVYNYSNGSLLYNLNNGENTSIWIDNGICEFVDTPARIFRPTATFKNQVNPNLEVDPTKLCRLVKKHFHLETKDDVLLLSLYLVTCFAGTRIAIPIFICHGDKGAGKSSTLRMIAQIVDPNTTGLTAIPRTRDDLAIRLHNSYMVAIDNISYLKQEFSDLLAMAVTGGTTMKRALFKDTEEIALELQSIVVLNGIAIIAKQPDLLDRAILCHQKRVESKEVKTDDELQKAFDKDLPDILGCCFQLLAEALNDKETLKVNQRTRLAGWFELAVKVGRGLGYEDEKTSALIWKNQKQVNQTTLADNVVASCIIELMHSQNYYKGSVSDLLGDLQTIGERNHIGKNGLPTQPNYLSRRLGEIKSNLEQEHGIFYNIRNVGAFRQIELSKEQV